MCALMTDLPLALQQLVNTAAAELGLGEADKTALELALTRAFTLGIKHANEIAADEHARNNRDD